MNIWQSFSLHKNRWRSSKIFIYIVISSAVFTDAYLYALIIPVLPFSLTKVVEIPENDVQWWISALLAAYGAGLLVGAPIVGHYADRPSSRKTPYLLGLIFLAVSTIAISLGRTLWILFFGRLIQGLSSASVHAVGMAILADAVSNDSVGLAMGFITTMMALGAALGPVVGGTLYHSLGYFAVFVSAYLLVAVDFILRILMVESKSGKVKGTTVDQTHGYGTFQRGSACGESDPVEDPDQTRSVVGPNLPPSPPSAPSAVAVGAIEPLGRRRSFHHPILELLSTPRMLVAILGDFMQSFILTGLETILPLRIKTVFSYNSQDVALVYLILSIPYAAGPLIGRLGDTYGPKLVVSSGYAGLMPLLMMLRLVDHYDSGQVVLLCILLLLIGTALNMVLTPAWSDTMYLVDEKSRKHPGIFGNTGAYAQAFGLMNMAYAVGSVLGPLLAGWLIEKVGFNAIALGTGILCGICVLPSFIYTGGREPRRE